MNILYITNHLNIGGITSYVLSLAAGLKKRGHNIYVASSGGDLLPKLITEGVSYIPIPIKTKKEISPKILASMLKLAKELKTCHIDIIHSHSRTTQVLGFLLSKKTNTPYISTCHGFFKKRILRTMFPCWGEKVIAISEPVKEHLIKDFKVDAGDIVVINNGIDVSGFRVQGTGFRAEQKKKLGLNDGPVVGIVARLSDVKGHIFLIEAMQDVLGKFPAAQLLIVGEGKIKDKLVNLCQRLGIQESVIFLPSVAQTLDVLAAMDVFVMPSLKEGLGLALMEAMACGLAVIGSRVGGIKSLIQHEQNGLLVEPANAKALAVAILELLQHPDKAESLGDNARIFIRENFSLEKMISQTEEVYLKCAGTKG